MTVYEWIRKHIYNPNVKERVTLDKDEIIIFKMKSGEVKVMSRVNLLGGVCDDCTDAMLQDQVSLWRKRKVRWDDYKPKAGKHSYEPT